MNLTIQFAERCQWRAVYVSRQLRDGCGRHQFFHMGVNPDSGVRPTFFGGVSNPFCRRGALSFNFSWRLPLPRIRWKHTAGPVRMWAYGLSSRFWHSVDGRY